MKIDARKNTTPDSVVYIFNKLTWYVRSISLHILFNKSSGQVVRVPGKSDNFIFIVYSRLKWAE
jgi:hypothetical protein